MSARRYDPPASERHFASVWHELVYVCRKVHYLLYIKRNRRSAIRFIDRLDDLVGQTPRNSPAIVRAEAFALLSHLRGELRLAIRYRKREVALIEKLRRSIGRSVRSGKLTQNDADVIYGFRYDAVGLRERRAILKDLGDIARGSK